jgi:hypothetical protein
MSKAKKKLMIPFTYGYEQMMDYCNYYYEEGTENSNKIWWDIKENKQISEPWHPREPIYSSWYNDIGGRERFERDAERYPAELEEYKNKKEQWDLQIQNKNYILVDAIVWKENFEFEDTMWLSGMSRGRSAANFNLVSQTDGKNYNLFMTDIVDMIQNAAINKGKIKGKWTFVKRGQNYGIKLVEEIPIN